MSKSLAQIDKIIQEKFAYLPGQLTGMTVSNESGVLRVDSGLQSDMFNIICCSRQPERGAVKRAIQHFRKKKLPFCWWVGFEKEPSWLCEELRQEQLERSEAELAMSIDLAKTDFGATHSDLVVKAGSAPDVVAVICSVVSSGEQEAIHSFFQAAESSLADEASALRFLVGYVEEEPVATSSIFVADELAAIFDVIVHPKMRGRGFGKEITLSAMRKAKAAGCRECVLTATNDAKYLYEKLGFAEVKEMAVYS